MTIDVAAPAALIHLDMDSDDPSPVEYARRLATAAARAGEAADKYGDGEVVRAAERLIAERLGKERAVLFATGTLANMLALDRLCPRFARRVLVHPDSHVLADTGDGAAAVMGLTLVTAQPSGAGFTAEAAKRAIAESRVGRVKQGIGAVVIETPVRRHSNAIFPIADLDAVVAAARAEGVGTHLDGARLPIAAQSAGRAIDAFCAPFDSVYLSLWKMLGLPFGAALAGPAALLESIEHDRRRHGGALPQLWPLAVMVLAHLDARLAQWPAIFERMARFRAALDSHPRIAIHPIGTEPTNAAWLEISGVAPAALRAAAHRHGLALPEAQGARFAVRGNASWLANDPHDIAARLVRVVETM
jgi:threonine aldolase